MKRTPFTGFSGPSCSPEALPARWIGRHTGHGYSLLELALLLTLMLVLAGIAAPITSHGFRSLELKLAADSFARELGRARLQALAENSPIAVQVEATRGSYQLVSAKDPTFFRGPQRFLGQKVSFVKVPSRLVVFYPWGTAAPAGTYQLSNRTGQIQIVVSLTGRIRLERVSS